MKQTGYEVCSMGFQYIIAKESLLPVKRVNCGFELSSLEPRCMLKQTKRVRIFITTPVSFFFFFFL